MSNVDVILSNAVEAAHAQNHEYVTLEHLVVSLFEDEHVVAVLEQVDCDWLTAKDDLETYLTANDFNGLVGEIPYDGRPKKTGAIERALQRAFAQVIFNAREQISTIDLFISILSESDTHAAYLCELNGINKKKIVEVVNKSNEF